MVNSKILLVAIISATVSHTAVSDGHIPDGAFWAVYNATADPADPACLVTEGDSVPESCCTGAGTFTPHSALQGDDTCFVLGPDLIPFSGCVGDGIAGYGENCEGEGAPFVAANAEECGCSFVIEGEIAKN